MTGRQELNIDISQETLLRHDYRRHIHVPSEECDSRAVSSTDVESAHVKGVDLELSYAQQHNVWTPRLK